MLRVGKNANNAYSARAYEAKALFPQFQWALIEKDRILEECEKLLMVQEAKIIDLGNDLVDCTQKLKAISTFSFERENLAKATDEQARQVEEQNAL